jgi:hypothetical protein
MQQKQDFVASLEDLIEGFLKGRSGQQSTPT